MFNSEKYYLFGKLLRTHGVKGGVVLEVSLDISDEDIKNLELVFILIDNLPVPFFIDEIKVYTKNRFIVNFIDVGDINIAEELCSSEVLIEKSQIPEYEKQLSIEDLVGFNVNDSSGSNLGIIDEFIDIDLSPTFKILKNNRELLIPANPDFITEINEQTKLIIINIPDGLLDLYQ